MDGNRQWWRDTAETWLIRWKMIHWLFLAQHEPQIEPRGGKRRRNWLLFFLFGKFGGGFFFFLWSKSEREEVSKPVDNAFLFMEIYIICLITCEQAPVTWTHRLKQCASSTGSVCNCFQIGWTHRLHLDSSLSKDGVLILKVAALCSCERARFSVKEWAIFIRCCLCAHIKADRRVFVSSLSSRESCSAPLPFKVIRNSSASLTLTAVCFFPSGEGKRNGWMARGVWLMSEKVTDIEEDRRRMEVRLRRKLEGGSRGLFPLVPYVVSALFALLSIWDTQKR